MLPYGSRSFPSNITVVIVNVGLPSLVLAASGSLSIERSSQRKVYKLVYKLSSYCM